MDTKPLDCVQALALCRAARDAEAVAERAFEAARRNLAKARNARISAQAEMDAATKRMAAERDEFARKYLAA